MDQCLEKLFRDVILAEGVLEAEVKFVGLAQLSGELRADLPSVLTVAINIYLLKVNCS